jgi:hypothetical protein
LQQVRTVCCVHCKWPSSDTTMDDACAAKRNKPEAFYYMTRRGAIANAAVHYVPISICSTSAIIRSRRLHAQYTYTSSSKPGGRSTAQKETSSQNSGMPSEAGCGGCVRRCVAACGTREHNTAQGSFQMIAYLNILKELFMMFQNDLQSESDPAPHFTHDLFAIVIVLP